MHFRFSSVCIGIFHIFYILFFSLLTFVIDAAPTFYCALWFGSFFLSTLSAPLRLVKQAFFRFLSWNLHTPLPKEPQKPKVDQSVLVGGVDDVTTRMQGTSFEGVVLNRYGIGDQGGKSYNFSHCDFTDCEGSQTVAVTVGEMLNSAIRSTFDQGCLSESPISMWLP